MCEVIKKTIEEATASAIVNTNVNSIKALMRTMNLTPKQAMMALEIPVADYEKYFISYN